jgi:hypothetical protein
MFDVRCLRFDVNSMGEGKMKKDEERKKEELKIKKEDAR